MKQIVGLDIGSRTIKAVELSRGKEDTLELSALGTASTPSGAPHSDAETDHSKLGRQIKTLFKDHRIRSRQVVVALPEPRVFTRVIEFPPLQGEELHNALDWEMERFIPLPREKVRVSWKVLREGQPPQGEEKGKKMKILLVAAPLDLIDRYLSIVNHAGLEPLAFESEINAIVRALTTPEEQAPVTLIISLGAMSTDLCIVDGGILQFTRSISTSGEDMAKAIARELGFDLNQAEEYKKAYGLESDKLGGKILRVIKPIFDIIVNEIEEAVLSYQNKVPMRPVKRVILVGGTACLPGVVVYLAESLGLEVQIGDPWREMTIPSELEGEVRRLENQTRFAVAVGLAKKNV